jgi:hypothetical protein
MLNHCVINKQIFYKLNNPNMTTRAKNGLSILCLIFFFIVAFASSHKDATFKDADNWIPQDFNPNKYVLLIQEHPANKKQNERMIEWLEKNYTYRYEVVDAADLKSKNGKYADSKTYQFAVVWDFKASQALHNNPNGQPSWSTVYNLYGSFIDRTNDKIYPATRKSNTYGQTAYIQFFNSVVQKFK